MPSHQTYRENSFLLHKLILYFHQGAHFAAGGKLAGGSCGKGQEWVELEAVDCVLAGSILVHFLAKGQVIHSHSPILPACAMFCSVAMTTGLAVFVRNFIRQP